MLPFFCPTMTLVAGLFCIPSASPFLLHLISFGFPRRGTASPRLWNCESQAVELRVPSRGTASPKPWNCKSQAEGYFSGRSSGKTDAAQKIDYRCAGIQKALFPTVAAGKRAMGIIEVIESAQVIGKAPTWDTWNTSPDSEVPPSRGCGRGSRCCSSRTRSRRAGSGASDRHWS